MQLTYNYLRRVSFKTVHFIDTIFREGLYLQPPPERWVNIYIRQGKTVLLLFLLETVCSSALPSLSLHIPLSPNNFLPLKQTHVIFYSCEWSSLWMRCTIARFLTFLSGKTIERKFHYQLEVHCRDRRSPPSWHSNNVFKFSRVEIPNTRPIYVSSSVWSA